MVVSLEDIKRHLNIDYNDDDYLLRQEAEAAEDALLAYLQRPLSSLIDSEGRVRPSFRQAVLLLTGNFHDSSRSGVAFSASSEVAFTLSFLLLPLKRFCSDDDADICDIITNAYGSIGTNRGTEGR